jgi:hypothetical protein
MFRIKVVTITGLMILAFAQFVDGQTCAPAPVGLVSWWPADGDVLDSRSRNNGVLQTGAGFSAGHAGQAFNFTAPDQRVEIPDDTSLDLTGAVTLEAWIAPSQPGDVSNASTLVSKSNLTTLNDQPYGLVYGSAGGVLMRIGNNSTFDQTLLTPALPLNVFSHIAGTYDGATIRIYLNGVEIDSKATTIGAMVSNNLTVKIGNNNRAGYVGRIDELAIYNRALSPSEIQALFNAGTAGKCKPTATVSPSGLVGWWAGDGNANDISGNNANGTLQNGAGFAVGTVGQAFNLVDGIDDHVDVGPGFDLDGLTLEAWVFISAGNNIGERRIISKDNVGLPGARKLFVLKSSCPGASGGENGRPCFGVVIGGAFDTVVAPSALTNGWHHLTAVRDTSANRFELYVDGILAASTTPTLLGAIDSNVNTVIGRVSPGSGIEHFIGLIDEAAIYNRGLTQIEITSIFNAGIAGKLKTAATPTGLAPEKGRRGERETIDKTKSRPVSQFAPDAVNITIGDATITFPTVTTSGITQQIPLATGLLPALPSGTHTGLVYDIATTSVFTGSPTVCFNVPAFTTGQFARLSVMHLENGSWIDVTAASNTFPTLCTNPVSSFSPFAITVALAPTAAPASISGRVLDSAGRGIRSAVVRAEAVDGTTRVAITNTFGHYQIGDLAAGQSYVLSITSKRHTFANPSRVINLTADLTNENFVADTP